MRGEKAADARWSRHREQQASAAHAPSNAQASTAQSSGDAPRCLDGDGDGDGDSEADPDEKQPPPPTPSVEHHAHDRPTAFEGATDPPDDVLWKAIQACRVTNGATRELLRPSGFTSWVGTATAAGYTVSEIVAGYRLYLGDATIKAKGHPTAVFITGDIWRVRMRVPPARPKARAF
jgi:hypothetical protein